MQILLTGGTGTLGAELFLIAPNIIAPSSVELDVTNPEAITTFLDRIKPDIIIHAAAETNNLLIEASPSRAIQVNILGSANIALACLNRRIRLVYLSTDYVYKGDRGNYCEHDEILPSNAYAWTKLGGEASVRLVPNHLIIRTSFGSTKFPYPSAFQDKWTSKDYVDEIAPLVFKAAISPLTGILNLGTERKTLYDYAKKRNLNIKPMRLGSSAYTTPYDTSLNLERWIQYQSQYPVARSADSCRVCSHGELQVYLDLGLMPLANNLAISIKEAIVAQRFPLQVVICNKCHLSQLSVIVDPDVLFGYYTYRSSINPSFVRHCYKMAQDLKTSIKLSSSDLVVDIAGNDGTLLKQFRDAAGTKILNIEPAGNIAAIASGNGVTTINDFWCIAVAENIVKNYQRPKLISATNVFAHVDDISNFLMAAKVCLDPEGIVVLEFPYLIDLVVKNEFDTVYFEHLSYLSVSPIVILANKLSMKVIRVEKQDIHGGSMRVFISPNVNLEPDQSVLDSCNREKAMGFQNKKIYDEWADGIYKLISSLSSNLLRLKQSGAQIAAFGASAKGNTLLNACRITSNIINYIVDDTPEKIGKYSPGTGIPIVNRSELIKNRPDYLLVLAWNFLDDVMSSTVDYSNAGGKYIVPIPEFNIVDNAKESRNLREKISDMA